MSFDKLERNIISVIKESQAKLGYEKMPLGINYIKPSLRHLLNDCTDDEIVPLLNRFAREKQDKFGDISIAETDGGYRLTVSEKGVELVHNSLSDNDFIVQFVNAIRQPDCNIDKVVALFKSFGENVHFEKTSNGEFEYLIYFEDGEPDEFYYCLDDDDFGVTYHRFTKEDYIDFGF